MPTELSSPHAAPRAPSPDSTQGELELVICSQDEVRTVPLPKAGDVSLGRAEGNDVRLDYPAVSRRHAVLRVGAQLSIEDLGGANGTFVRDDAHARTNEQTLSLRQLAGEASEIAVGDGVVLGSITLVVRRRAKVTPGCHIGEGPGDGETDAVVRSPALKRVYQQAERAAQATIAVLILGETGVGKEVLARAIHARSPRANGPFMAVNCAALSETLIEGELFGHERGAFTGAVQARAGLFEAAEGGSVFLDELGELSLSTQAKLLRVLEERAVMRLGARVVRKVDVRFIAATNRDLSIEVATGRFRQDLYFRLNGISLTVPPLRERPEEIEALVHLFVAQASEQLEQRTPMSVPSDVMARFRRYTWPGNVRELKNIVERAVILCDRSTLSPADLPKYMLSDEPANSAAPLRTAAREIRGSQPPSSETRPMRAEIRSLERERIISALDECDGNQTQTAKLLGISRRTLTTRLAEFALPRPRKPRDACE